MYVPHYAAALAVKGRVPRAPIWALLIGAFLPDLVWIVLARAGVEPAQPATFFDDWSHSFVSILVLAIIYGCLFWRESRTVRVALGVAVFSHFLLDFPVHPKRLALFPLSGIPLGWDLSNWGSAAGWLSAPNDWWLQTVVLIVLLGVFAQGMWRAGLSWRTISIVSVLLVALQLLMLFPCIGY